MAMQLKEPRAKRRKLNIYELSVKDFKKCKKNGNKKRADK